MNNRHSMAFLDLEADAKGERILDVGALREDGAVFHGASPGELRRFLASADILCGHNIFHHDLPLLERCFGLSWHGGVIDTLYLSPLLFPRRPYHALVKDDKLQADELNNPVNDCQKARSLYADEVNAFLDLPEKIRGIYGDLLREIPEFRGFWAEMGVLPGAESLSERIQRYWENLICAHAPLDVLIRNTPVETAYALAVTACGDEASVTPGWVLRNYPRTSDVLRALRAAPCRQGCAFCRQRLDLRGGLRRIFGYPDFRTYDGEPLQENAARAAMEEDSLLAIFPTGGGKSLTFQLPALLLGESIHALTVVISPLQALMKDQVDHLSALGLTGAVSINGMLSPLERASAIRQVKAGSACLLMIAPEQLRSATVRHLLQSRTIARFVIDEAHCLSAWGQEFRVDYLYIGDFIRELQESRPDTAPIPVSCFTATAKQKVIQDIRDYFLRKLNLRLTLFATEAQRENLHYTVLFRETDQDKYNTIRQLLGDTDCPAIVYVTRTRKAVELAEQLRSDGFAARAFHGKMDPAEKTENQDAFLRGDVRVMVATSAFGMGVDKQDVGLVIHFEISDSLENYIQEAGRAGRDPRTRAECYVLFNNNDLDRHFILLNQTRLSMGEIQQVWRAIKELTRNRQDVQCSPLEIARQAGWETSGSEMETRVKAAVAALENAGYVERRQNVPHLYASSIQVRTMAEAGQLIRRSPQFTEAQQRNALRVLQLLISKRSIARAGNDDAESRVDYIADILGLEKREVLDTIHLLRREGILADARDLSAFLPRPEARNRAELTLRRFQELEIFLLDHVMSETGPYELKRINEAAQQAGHTFSSVRNLRTILYYWTLREYVRKTENRERDLVWLEWIPDETAVRNQQARRFEMSRFALKYLYDRADKPSEARETVPVNFSLVALFRAWQQGEPEGQTRMVLEEGVSLRDMEDALLYLARIGALKLEGGFLVLYQGMQIHRIVTDNRARFKQEDYRLLDEFYRQRIQQIHIVGEYANMMVRDYPAALAFVRDYFRMEHQKFIDKYFRGERKREITRNITPKKYRELFGSLSQAQADIIGDARSRIIVAAAGPGSGKTRVLVSKLASLLLMEDVKHEQLLMLTFTRAAATEFKKRLRDLIGNAAHFVEIKTFHSYCFDLLGKTGSLEAAADAVPAAVRMIESGEIEPDRIRKAVLVVDEAQDMDRHEYALVLALAAQHENMRIIAAGDDDQNIFAFRGSSPEYLRALGGESGARICEMPENYRSLRSIVEMENAFAARIPGRMKALPLRAVREEAGRVCVIRHRFSPFLRSAVRQMRETWRGGSAALLTSTNEEALQLFTLLHREGIRVRMLRGMEGFSLSNILEIRVFLNFLDSRLQGRPVISRELWDQAKAHTEKRCEGSAALDICRNLWTDFEQTASTRYRSDLENFIRESREEDFQREEGETVTVATVHRAKGREYDQVYLVLQGNRPRSEEEMRRIYVGMTRAKDELYIHCAPGDFAFDLPACAEQTEDSSRETEPEEVLLQLGHRDVVLSFFRTREHITGRLLAGMPLGLEDAFLTAELDGKKVRAARLSRAGEEKVAALKAGGYRFQEGSIRHVVAWKPEEDPAECWILLPDLVMRKPAASGGTVPANPSPTL